jgi:DNA-binding Lrp family transcriptional regulator
VRAYVLINARTSEEREVTRALRRMPGVLRADDVFGSYDVIAEIEGPDLAAIGKLVFETIRVMPGVTDTLTCLAAE